MALVTAEGRADFPANFDLLDLDGSNGMVLHGQAEEDWAGTSVSAAGDVNGDGFEDLIIGAPYVFSAAADAGSSYIIFGTDQGLPAVLELSSIDGTNGIVINGMAQSDSSGFSVSGAGDFNGDGIDDVIIGAPDASPGANGAGSSYLVFGSNEGLPSPLSLATINGSNGLVINGDGVFSNSGRAVGAGDINGDGFDDLVIGSFFGGNAYIVFGGDPGPGSPLNLSNLNGSNGFRMVAIDSADSFGESVGSAGDINHDGIDDLVIGAPLAGPSGANPGAAYVIFGTNLGFPNPLTMSSLNGTNGIAINGVTVSDMAGISVNAAGDVNGDGIDDLVVGAHEANPNGADSGASYVIFGSDEGLPHPLNLSTLDGTNGFVINGVGMFDESGTSVDGAGDINGDNIDDLIIGAPNAFTNGEMTGAGYVVFGSNQPWSATFELSSLDGANGFRLEGVSAGDLTGKSVSAAGDFNADGKNDIILGAPFADPNGSRSGSIYAVFDASTTEPNPDTIFADGFEP